MGTNCALLVANLFLFCYERVFLMSLSYDMQAVIIYAFRFNIGSFNKIKKFIFNEIMR